MKTTPKAALRRAAFVQALALHGNIAQAARAAGVTSAVFYQARKRDARFAAEWDAALLAGRAAAEAGAATRPRDTALWGARSGRAQLRRMKGHRWTAETEAIFLATLAMECTVTKAAKAAGFSTESAYQQRKFSPTFRIGWNEALDEAMARMAMKLARQAMNGLEAAASDSVRLADDDEDRPIPDPQFALTVLKEHHARAAGTRNPGRSAPRKGPDIATVHARVIAQIAVVKRQLEGGA